MSLTERDFSLHSGERALATAEDDICPCNIARYEFACSILKDMQKPLIGADIFCGVGYGSQLLARKLPCFLLAIDGSEDSIRAANEQYCNINIFFIHKLFPFFLPKNHFDFIVSIESIEHIEDGERFFHLLSESIKPGGKLIISAPNSEIISLKKNPYPWHYHHYSVKEIHQLGLDNGLEYRGFVGADCVVIDKNGKAVAANYYSPASGELRPDYAGDTLTYVFHKQKC